MNRSFFFILLALCCATTWLSAQTEYRVGAGKAIVTDPACGLGMVGFADDSQKTNGIDLRLYARTFIVEHKASRKRVVFMNADLWALPHAIKRNVIIKLKNKYGNLYDYDNCHFSATHTHSGPGGYSEYNLYNYTIGGFDQTNFNLIVNGIVRSISFAHDKLADGNIYYGATQISDCGRNRSVPAYNRNPVAERNRYKKQTDNTLYLLKFTQLFNGRETPVGALSWYAIHPTDRGQSNTKVSGDNKGFASRILEKKYPKFIAAFANGSAGDVSGNIEFGQLPDGVNDQRNVEKHGRQQANAADGLLSSSRMTRLSGKIDYRHQFWDMSKRTGSPGALGLSFGAGSTEDSDPGSGIKEGITVDDITNGQVAKSNQIIKNILDWGINVSSPLRSRSDRAQYPKPVLFYTGKPAYKGAPLTPNVLPFQLIRIGKIAITGIPAEINTMAGRRVQETVLSQLPGVDHVILGGYANHYSQYVTTPEEYDAQHYEGASTLFGRNTLSEYLKIYGGLASALANGSATPTKEGHFPVSQLKNKRVVILNRITVRNLSSSSKTFGFYNSSDLLMVTPFKEVTVPGKSEVAIIFDVLKPTSYKVKMNNQSPIATKRGRLLRVNTAGKLEESGYKRRNFIQHGNPRPLPTTAPNSGGSDAVNDYSVALTNKSMWLVSFRVKYRTGWTDWKNVDGGKSASISGRGKGTIQNYELKWKDVFEWKKFPGGTPVIPNNRGMKMTVSGNTLTGIKIN